jgi:hypothetical protein
MTEPVLLPGNRFRLYRESDVTPGQFVFVCVATTITFNRTNSFEDTTVADCDNPLATPNRKSVKTSTAWNLNFSGNSDIVRIAGIEADFEAEGTHNYQMLLDKPAVDGGRTYTGAVFVETFELAKQNNGLVSFSAQMRGDGALVKAAVA